MKKIWCWLTRHDWQPITEPEEVKAEIKHFLETGALRMAKCGRCGQKA